MRSARDAPRTRVKPSAIGGFEAGESQPGKRLQGATRNVSTRFESLPSHSETPSEARRLEESSGGPASEASGTSSEHGSDGERSEPRDESDGGDTLVCEFDRTALSLKRPE